MKKERTRDRLDLLLSSKHWPVVYAVDMACDVVAHAEVQNPLLANVLWSDRRSCFERPKHQHTPKVQIWSSVIYVYSLACRKLINHSYSINSIPYTPANDQLYNYIVQVTHIPELKKVHSQPVPSSHQIIEEHNYSQSMVHPLTQTVDRYIVGDRFHDGPKTSGHKRDTCRFHNMKWCPELLNFQSVTSEVINSRIKTTRLKCSSQQNLTHYFFYNRLMDHWDNVSIVSKQFQQMQAKSKRWRGHYQRQLTQICVCLLKLQERRAYKVILF